MVRVCPRVSACVCGSVTDSLRRSARRWPQGRGPRPGRSVHRRPRGHPARANGSDLYLADGLKPVKGSEGQRQGQAVPSRRPAGFVCRGKGRAWKSRTRERSKAFLAVLTRQDAGMHGDAAGERKRGLGRDPGVQPRGQLAVGAWGEGGEGIGGDSRALASTGRRTWDESPGQERNSRNKLNCEPAESGAPRRPQRVRDEGSPTPLPPGPHFLCYATSSCSALFSVSLVTVCPTRLRRP